MRRSGPIGYSDRRGVGEHRVDLRGRLKNDFQIVLVLFMAITDKAWDANQRTLSKQFHQQRMGVDSGDVARSAQAGPTGPLHAAQRDRSHSLYRAQRLWLADD